MDQQAELEYWRPLLEFLEFRWPKTCPRGVAGWDKFQWGLNSDTTTVRYVGYKGDGLRYLTKEKLEELTNPY